MTATAFAIEPTEAEDPRNALIDAAVGTVEAVARQDPQLATALIARLQGLYPVKAQPAPAGPFDAMALAQILTALRVTASRRLTEADHLAVVAAKQLVLAAMAGTTTAHNGGR